MFLDHIKKNVINSIGKMEKKTRLINIIKINKFYYKLVLKISAEINQFLKTTSLEFELKLYVNIL